MNTENQPKKKLGVGKIILIGIGAIVLISIIANMGSNDAAEAAPASTESSATQIAKTVAVGQALKTDYFDVTVNKVSVLTEVKTGNEFSDIKAEADTKFLVFNVTFKNTDKESRMITDGEVHINYNGQEYNFDKSETLLVEGYGLLLDQINPLTSKTTNLVYKLPKEIKGKAFYNPGRSDSDQTIDLGDIQ